MSCLMALLIDKSESVIQVNLTEVRSSLKFGLL